MGIDSEGDRSKTTLTDLPEAPQIKIEPEDSLVTDENQPVLQLDRENFKKVARILRGRSKATDNCAHLVQAFIDYLRTGKMPTQPAPTDSATLEHLTFVWNSEHIPVGFKLEPGVTPPSAEIPTIETITHSHIDRNTTFGMNTPYGEIPREVNGKIDLTIPPIYDLDRSMQKSVLYTELNAALKNEAESNGGVSFGMVSMAPRAPSMFGPNHLFFNQDNQVAPIIPVGWTSENPNQNDRKIDVRRLIQHKIHQSLHMECLSILMTKGTTLICTIQHSTGNIYWDNYGTKNDSKW